MKLGTINPNNPDAADVYSYAKDEDCMVRDPKLADHLMHWGIRMDSMTKTDRTMAELEYDLNKNYDFDSITEAGSTLVPVAGPGLTGLINLGNSCYMNGTIQLLLSPSEAISPLAVKFGSPAAAAELLRSAPPDDPAGDVLTQLAKLANGLLSGEYAALKKNKERAGEEECSSASGARGEEESEVAVAVAAAVAEHGALIRPQMFKSAMSCNHAEFSSGRQQDAVEYLQYLLETVQRAERAGQGRLTDAAAAAGSAAGSDGENPGLVDYFKFGTQHRLECTASKTVRYKAETETVLTLDIPLEAAVNKAEVEEAQARKRKRDAKHEDVVESVDAAGAAVTGGRTDEEKAPLPVVALEGLLR